MNIISKINLRKALRFFLLLAAFSMVIMPLNNVSADGKEETKAEKEARLALEEEARRKKGDKDGWFANWEWWQIILTIVVLVAIVGGGIYFYMNRSKEEEA